MRHPVVVANKRYGISSISYFVGTPGLEGSVKIDYALCNTPSMQARAKNHQYDVRRLLSEAGRKDLIEILVDAERKINKVAMRELRPLKLQIDPLLYLAFHSKKVLSILYSLTTLCPSGDGASIRPLLIRNIDGDYVLCMVCESHGFHRFCSEKPLKLH
ncbi:MAG: hypothetical protein KIS30_04145 [Thermoplasmata archaeon]|nr:hypothetical protein [Candidatus Sysuiplasma acidicola]MBX8645936.1 hypothetical protein [Candidatus Sysuiplasma acidicola]